MNDYLAAAYFDLLAKAASTLGPLRKLHATGIELPDEFFARGVTRERHARLLDALCVAAGVLDEIESDMRVVEQGGQI